MPPAGRHLLSGHLQCLLMGGIFVVFKAQLEAEVKSIKINISVYNIYTHHIQHPAKQVWGGEHCMTPPRMAANKIKILRAVF